MERLILPVILAVTLLLTSMGRTVAGREVVAIPQPLPQLKMLVKQAYRQHMKQHRAHRVSFDCDDNCFERSLEYIAFCTAILPPEQAWVCTQWASSIYCECRARDCQLPQC